MVDTCLVRCSKILLKSFLFDADESDLLMLFCVLVDTLVNIGKQVLQERNADVSKAR